MNDSRCGTNAGYTAHSRNGTPVCSPCSEAHRDYLKSRRHLYRNKYREYQTEWAASHRESGQKATRKWRETHPEKHMESAAKSRQARRARKYFAPSEPYTTALVLETYGEICHLCQNPIDLTAPRAVMSPGWEKGLHLDHVVPLIVGGADTLDNIRPAHGKCNLNKPRKFFTSTIN